MELRIPDSDIIDLLRSRNRDREDPLECPAWDPHAYAISALEFWLQDLPDDCWTLEDARLCFEHVLNDSAMLDEWSEPRQPLYRFEYEEAYESYVVLVKELIEARRDGERRPRRVKGFRVLSRSSCRKGHGCGGSDGSASQSRGHSGSRADRSGLGRRLPGISRDSC